MAWSREDISTLRMSLFWNDTAEEIAAVLSKDVSEVLAKAAELGLSLKRLDEITGAACVEGLPLPSSGASAILSPDS
jgi:hypothetical protein